MAIELGTSAFVGVMLLIALWPTDKTAAQVLRKWNVADPTPAQVAESKVYLKRRRLLYPWLFLAIGYAKARLLPLEDGYFTAQVLTTVLAGMLLAELIAAVRPSKGVRRVAVLVPRRVRDLVPTWGLIAYFTGVDVVVVLLALTRPVAVPALVLLAFCVLASTGAIVLAVKRPTSGDEVVDDAFRLRSARVALGLGMAMTGLLVTSADVGGFAVLALCLVLIGLGWGLVSPPRAEAPVRR
ncbi:hypothetical protein ACFFQW_23770 [Umezawaea endophytica]|uniref:Uncharacterized protein n=1 Tax=Umezawaea endophytica TaxID=1654476 RepID=A0A9X2VR75_9PSEU|nr:hypothetical protein [Umezawaea endophytica]MCS7480714.1 hypothetical protein [Umezawaea endophytica]